VTPPKGTIMAENATDQEAGTVNWKAAGDFLTGQAQAAENQEAPPASESAANETPEVVEVSIRGRKVKMSAEDAEAYQEFVRDTRDRDGRLGGEMQNLRDRLAKTEGMLEVTQRAVKPADEIRPPDPKLAEEDFGEYNRQWQVYTDAKTARVRAELLDEIESRENRRTQVQSEDDVASRFVSTFYSRHEHLSDPETKDVVQLVYQKHAQEIDGLRKAGRNDEAQDRLAELADAKIVALRAGSKQANSNKPPRIEGRGTPPTRAAAPEPEAEFSASDWVRQKRAALRGDKKK